MTVVSINISKTKGEKKKGTDCAVAIEGIGLEGDAHAGSKREISLLAVESIQKMGGDLAPGDFAENITTSGIDLMSLPVGSIIRIGDEAMLEITEHGKVCHARCNIYYKHGRCIMPEEGVFARVIRGGHIKRGDAIEIVS